MRCRPCKPAQREGGAALVVAMLVFALCAALVVALQTEFSRLFARSSGLLIAEQSRAYLRGAEDLASLILMLDYDQDAAAQRARDDLNELWAQEEPPPYALDDGGWMRGRLVDLQGRFNLNNLVPPQQRRQPGQSNYTPYQAQFIRLLQLIEEPQISEFEAIAITDAIGDWIDGDNNVSPQGAEDDYYASRDPAHRAANRLMESVSELLVVANVTPELYVALQPYVTALPESGTTMNIHTASPVMLRTINSPKDLSPLSEFEGQALWEYRDETGFIDLDDFIKHPSLVDKPDIEDTRNALLGESTAYFLLSAEVELAQRNTRLYSVLQRRDRRVTSLRRAAGSL